jgi:hypothetical protein
MLGFFNTEEEDEKIYVPDPNMRMLMAVGYVLFFIILIFVICPFESRNSRKHFEEMEKKAIVSFRADTFHGVFIKSESRNRKKYMTLKGLDGKTFEKEVESDELYKIYEELEIGDTIEKRRDTIYTVIRNYPKLLIRRNY